MTLMGLSVLCLATPVPAAGVGRPAPCCVVHTSRRAAVGENVAAAAPLIRVVAWQLPVRGAAGRAALAAGWSSAHTQTPCCSGQCCPAAADA